MSGISTYKAMELAIVAHTAAKQFRADGETPYWYHPMRVARYTSEFETNYGHEFGEMGGSTGPRNLKNMVVAAYLHDVLEDTGIDRDTLLNPCGLSYEQLALVEGMTKEPEKNRTREQIAEANRRYLQRISESDELMIIKAADRCANLDDSYTMLLVPAEKLEVKRWKNYVNATRADVLPMYKLFPGLRSEIEQRVEKFEKMLPRAESARAYYVAEQRRKKGIAA